MSEESSNDPSSKSALDTVASDFRSALDEFRENWQRELKGQNKSNENDGGHGSSQTTEQQAEILFKKAVELEQRGKVYDALPLYRKAVQMMPDIEFKYYENHKKEQIQNDSNKLISAMDKGKEEKNTSNEQSLGDGDGDGDDTEVDDLMLKFRDDIYSDEAYNGKLILSNRDPGVITTEKHISDLPPEIMNLILRWVISSQLDLRSLDQCSAVCKGFYLLARDEKIWRLACKKVWGHNLGILHDKNENNLDDANETEHMGFLSWREMFLSRERLHFHGCYISKTTYLRMGENSFQDQFYRPVQLVEYYRYVRFLPDGKVIMMTNADEPPVGVTKLRNLQNLRPDVLHGYYRLFGPTVTLVLQKHMPKNQIPSNQYAKHRRGSNATIDSNLTKYIIEFKIASSKRRKFVQLIWQHYSIQMVRNKIESSTNFDLTAAKYPPLWFSAVQSYHLETDAPLI